MTVIISNFVCNIPAILLKRGQLVLHGLAERLPRRCSTSMTEADRRIYNLNTVRHRKKQHSNKHISKPVPQSS